MGSSNQRLDCKVLGERFDIFILFYHNTVMSQKWKIVDWNPVCVIYVACFGERRLAQGRLVQLVQ